jgi:hypothetical protein
MYHAFYTADKTLISTVERKKDTTTYEVPAGAVYVRLTVYNSRDPLSFVATIGMKDGFVWFLTGASSTVAYNALKKNDIEVYPMSAKQYIGGAWVDVSAKSCQNGEWVDWWNGELFSYGNEFEAVTGGWISTPALYNKSGDGSSGTDMTPTKNSNGGYTLYHGGSTKGVIWHTANPIDVTDVKEIKFVGSLSASNGNHVGLALYSKIEFCIQNRAAYLTGVLQHGTHTLNVAEVSGEYYVGFHVYNASTIVVDEIIME